MKKIVIVFSVFFALLVIQSCFPTEYYDIVDIKFKAVGERNNEGKTSIRGALQFTIYYELEFQRVAYRYVPKLIPECHAMSRPNAIDNKLLHDSFSLYFDKSFTFQDEIIPAGTNILENINIKNEMTIYEKTPDKLSIFEHSTKIDFSKSFIDNSIFEGDYTVNFSCKTSDSRAFQKSTEITFNNY